MVATAAGNLTVMITLASKMIIRRPGTAAPASFRVHRLQGAHIVFLIILKRGSPPQAVVQASKVIISTLDHLLSGPCLSRSLNALISRSGVT